jgi:hypothetical protein
MAKIEQNICPVCGAKLNFTRQELAQLSIEIKKAKGSRYFLSDENVALLVCEFHKKLGK